MKNKMKFHWTNRLGIATFITALILLASVPAKAQDGKTLYGNLCASCHKIAKDNVGPMLQGAKARWEEAGEAENVYKWVKDPVGLVNSGTSTYAKEISAFSPSDMTSVGAGLTNEEIDAIFEYADSYVAPVKAEKADDVVEEEYDQPNTYLFAGRFYDKNSAYKFKHKIKSDFPDAIVIKKKLSLPPLKLTQE